MSENKQKTLPVKAGFNYFMVLIFILREVVLWVGCWVV